MKAGEEQPPHGVLTRYKMLKKAARQEM